MCTVKTGRDVTNTKDLQNLITSIILQQNGGFDEDSVIEEAFQLLDGSKMQKHRMISDIVSNTLMTFVLNDILYLDHGKYQAIEYIKAM